MRAFQLIKTLTGAVTFAAVGALYAFITGQGVGPLVLLGSLSGLVIGLGWAFFGDGAQRGLAADTSGFVAPVPASKSSSGEEGGPAGSDAVSAGSDAGTAGADGGGAV